MAKRNGPNAVELKLVAKLDAAGQLKAGYLLKALKDHQLGLFEAALAKLGNFRVEDVHRAVMSRDRPELVALACAAVAIDRSAFPTILELVRQAQVDGLLRRRMARSSAAPPAPLVRSRPISPAAPSARPSWLFDKARPLRPWIGAMAPKLAFVASDRAEAGAARAALAARYGEVLGADASTSWSPSAATASCWRRCAATCPPTSRSTA